MVVLIKWNNDEMLITGLYMSFGYRFFVFFFELADFFSIIWHYTGSLSRRCLSFIDFPYCSREFFFNIAMERFLNTKFSPQSLISSNFRTIHFWFFFELHQAFLHSNAFFKNGFQYDIVAKSNVSLLYRYETLHLIILQWIRILAWDVTRGEF